MIPIHVACLLKGQRDTEYLKTALEAAARAGNMVTVRELLALGAKPNLPADDDGEPVRRLCFCTYF